MMTSRGHLLILANDAIRRKAKDWIDKAPIGYRVRFQEAKRSTAQSDRMWAMIGDVARQKTHYGQKYNTETWKCLFMDSLGREVIFIPALDGDGVIPIGLRSSDLSVQEMSDLIAFIESWAVQNGVTLHDKAEALDPRPIPVEPAKAAAATTANPIKLTTGETP